MATNLTKDEGIQLTINAISIVSMLYLIITLLGPISGAHFNPVVTLGELFKNRIDAKSAGAYIVAQFAGAALALILVTTLHWLRNAVRSLATNASVLMHDTTHGLIFGGAQVWALGTVDVQQHGHRIALSIVNKAGGDANWYTKLLKKLKDCVNHVARHMHGTASGRTQRLSTTSGNGRTGITSSCGSRIARTSQSNSEALSTSCRSSTDASVTRTLGTSECSIAAICLFTPTYTDIIARLQVLRARPVLNHS
jgi:hypothetical protein